MNKVSITQDQQLSNSNISRTEENETSRVTFAKYSSLKPMQNSIGEPQNAGGIWGLFRKINSKENAGSYAISAIKSPKNMKLKNGIKILATESKVIETNSVKLPLKNNLMSSENNISTSFDSIHPINAFMVAKDEPINNEVVNFGIPIYMNVQNRKYSEEKTRMKQYQKEFKYIKNKVKSRTICEESKITETICTASPKIQVKNSISVISYDDFEEDEAKIDYTQNSEVKSRLKQDKTESKLRKIESKPKRIVQESEMSETEYDSSIKVNRITESYNCKKVFIAKQDKSGNATSVQKNSKIPRRIIEKEVKMDAEDIFPPNRNKRTTNCKIIATSKQQKSKEASFTKKNFKISRRIASKSENTDTVNASSPKMNEKNRNCKEILFSKQLKSMNSFLVKKSSKIPRKIVEKSKDSDLEKTFTQKKYENNCNFKKISNSKENKTKNAFLFKRSSKIPRKVYNKSEITNNAYCTKLNDRTKNYQETMPILKQHNLRNTQLARRDSRKYTNIKYPGFMQYNHFVNKTEIRDRNENSFYGLEAKDGSSNVRQVFKSQSELNKSTKVNESHAITDYETKFKSKNTAHNVTRSSSNQNVCIKSPQDVDEKDKVVIINIMYQFFPRRSEEDKEILNNKG